MPLAKTGRPVVMMPSQSRARPSVTMAVTAALTAMAANRSPTTADPLNASVAATITSPG
jgi:hypothetical protein